MILRIKGPPIKQNNPTKVELLKKGGSNEKSI